MSPFPDDPFESRSRKNPVSPDSVSHDIGQTLDTLSVDELSERIVLLQTEILRLEAKKMAKLSSKNAANQFFKS